MSTEWVAIEWKRQEDIDAMNAAAVTICRVHSPFYEGERYAVRQLRNCLNKKGKWEYEPLPSSRTDAFYRRCRFLTFDDAVEAAGKAVRT